MRTFVIEQDSIYIYFYLLIFLKETSGAFVYLANT